jgi:multidrug resistance efflux pump
MHPDNHDIAVAATKKADTELKQAVSAATREYDKKRKCVELEKVEREKAVNISDITTKVPFFGVIGQLDVLGGKTG